MTTKNASVSNTAPTPQMKSTRYWLTAEGQKKDDKFVYDWVKAAAADKFNEYELIVGTDSHLHGREFRFITVICLYRKGKGGMYYYTTAFEPRDTFKSNRPGRMFFEVGLSIELANQLVDETGLIPVVHIDASPKEAGEFTSSFSDQLKGYVLSSGFEAVLKPQSFVANAVADRHTK